MCRIAKRDAGIPLEAAKSNSSNWFPSLFFRPSNPSFADPVVSRVLTPDEAWQMTCRPFKAQAKGLSQSVERDSLLNSRGSWVDASRMNNGYPICIV